MINGTWRLEPRAVLPQSLKAFAGCWDPHLFRVAQVPVPWPQSSSLR